MKKQELIEKYEYLNHDCFRRVDTSEVLKDLKQLDEPEKVKIPQFVADWIDVCKENSAIGLYTAMNPDFLKQWNKSDELISWSKKTSNQEIFARAWLDGYTIEEKRYMVKVKGVNDYGRYLNKGLLSKEYFWESKAEIGGCRTKHTRKQLEEDNFGWVFDCPGIEIEEVTE